MFVLHLNTDASQGGAGRAAYRLHGQLAENGHDSRIIARSSSITNKYVSTLRELAPNKLSSIRFAFDFSGRKLEIRGGFPFLRYQLIRNLFKSSWFEKSDVVNLHNLHGGYFNLRLLSQFSKEKPTVWTLHDMWALTGHCAYSYDCLKWKTECYNCPLLKNSTRNLVEPKATRIDRTKNIWRLKRRIYKESILHVVTPSRWLEDIVRCSILNNAVSIQCIPNGVDLSIFRPRDKNLARKALDIPLDSQVVMFVAMNLDEQRKGHRHLVDALSMLTDKGDLFLLTVGNVRGVNPTLKSIPIRNLGTMSDERLMSLAYNAADLFVFPTMSDNQPLVLIEALACGLPTVSFDVGGVPEMIRHLETGYLAKYLNSEDMAYGIRYLLENSELRGNLARNCRGIAEIEYSVELQASRYQELYQQVIDSTKDENGTRDRS